MLRLASGIILALPVIAAVASPMMKRAIPFFNPVQGGGSWLDNAGDGFGEPLNVSVFIIQSRLEPILICVDNSGRHLRRKLRRCPD